MYSTISVGGVHFFLSWKSKAKEISMSDNV